jgi:hypothetical protein
MARLFFCVDAALMEMSMAIILYCHNPIPFVWHAFFVLMQLLWKCRWQLFCISVLPQPNANSHFSAKKNCHCEQQRLFCFPFVWHAFFVLMQLLWKCRWQLFCISVLPQPNSICMARLFCIDAALMEMSMAIILYQCIATTQCQLSLFGQAKV